MPIFLKEMEKEIMTKTMLAVVTASEQELNKAPNFIQPIISLDSIRRLLRHSWKDIGFEYDGLTASEKECITREEHALLLPWVLTAP